MTRLMLVVVASAIAHGTWATVATSWTMDYAGAIQTFTAPCSGSYKLEVWGAQGGWFDGFQGGGKGGYASC